MLKQPLRKTPHSPLASSLLVLLVMALSSAANAQSGEAAQLQMPDGIVDVDIAPSSASEPASTSGEGSTGLCEQPEHWLYAKQYETGDLASHGGKVWKVIKTTKGDMPGMNKPPFWEQVRNHCAAASQ